MTWSSKTAKDSGGRRRPRRAPRWLWALPLAGALMLPTAFAPAAFADHQQDDKSDWTHWLRQHDDGDDVRVPRGSAGALLDAEIEPGVRLQVTETDGNTAVAEGGARDTVQLSLTRRPSQRVFVFVVPDSQLRVDRDEFRFRATDWDKPRSLEVRAADDDRVEGPHTGRLWFVVADKQLRVVTVHELEVDVTDNDGQGQGITLAQSGGGTAVAEGGASDTYTIRLNAQPSGNVTIFPTTGSQLTLAPAALVFTPANWSTPQTVTVGAVDDAVAEGPHSAVVTHSGSGGGFDGLTLPSVTVAISDNDGQGITIAQSGGSTAVAEGGASDTYTIRLNAQPSGNVTITPVSTSQIKLTPVGLTFTPSNWNTPQTVTVQAVDDTAMEGPHSTVILHVGTGPGFSGVDLPQLTVSITDNDTSILAISQSGGSTAVGEGAGGDTYTVRLNAAPSGPVTVTVQAAPQLVASPSSLTFLPTNWSVPQTVTLWAVDDNVVEGQHGATVSHRVFGSGFDAANEAPFAVSISDNDFYVVSIVQTNGSTAVSEGGPADSYSLVMDRQPPANVTITAVPNGQVTVSPSVVTFTRTNWSTPQVITVTALDDAVVEGPHEARITHTVSGMPAAVQVGAVSVAVSDNDGLPLGVDVTPMHGTVTVSEGGESDTYLVRLNSAPSSPVTVQVVAPADVTAYPSALVFTPANWSAPQTVTVIAADDGIAQGARAARIRHVAIGGGYDAVAIPDVEVQIDDSEASAPQETVALPLGRGLQLVGWFGTPTTAADLLEAHPALVRIWWWNSATDSWVVDDLSLPPALRTTIAITRGAGFFAVTSAAFDLQVPVA